MRVLQINTIVNSGSTGRIAEQLGQQVLKAGGKSFIAASRMGNESRSEVYKIGNDFDVYRHVLVTRIFDRHGFSSKGATKKLIMEIKKIDPDIIHLHNLHGYYLHVGTLFKFISEYSKPVIWTFHDCWPFTGHCSYFERFNCDKWKTSCFECPMKSYYPASWVLDNSKNNFFNKKTLFTGIENLTIVTPSLWLKELVGQSFFRNVFPVKVIHNGVDLNVMKPSEQVEKIKAQYKLAGSKTILGIAGIWDKRKGLDDFFKLATMLDQQSKIVLIGLKKEQLRDLPPKIIGIERTESVKMLADLYSAADVYINPTYSDNFPTTNIEALACGTPVITYDTGGSPEAVDTNTGIVVDKGNVEGLQAAIEKVIKGIDQGKRYTRDLCRNRAVHYFNKDERFQEYTELYKRLLTEE